MFVGHEDQHEFGICQNKDTLTHAAAKNEQPAIQHLLHGQIKRKKNLRTLTAE
jgi:hypothetical protein